MKENLEECIYRLSRGECTKDEEQQLARWIGESDENRRLYEELASIARDSRALQGRERLNKQEAWSRVRRRTTGGMIAARVIRYAASICLPFLLVTAYLLLRPGTPSPVENREEVTIKPGTTRATLYLSDGQGVDLQEYRGTRVSDHRAAREIAFEEGTNTLNYHDTLLASAPDSRAARHKIIVPRGGEYPLTLPDGTRVWLNAETEIEFPLAFGSGSREVSLRGEAFFEVKKESGRPFIVHAREEASVEVTGTSFNLSCYPDDATVTTAIESGSVTFIANHRENRLKAGERATYRPLTREIAVEEGIEMKYHSSWRHGTFYFHDTPLREIAGKLGRWYDVRFEFADPSLEALCFSGAASRARPIEFTLELLERTCSVRFSTRGRVVRVEQE
jgi:ferric-dicitrate binding protein FerR (iron transport regulator)